MKKMISRGKELYGREVFDILFEYEVSRSQRYPAPLALLKIEMTSSILGKDPRPDASAIFAAEINAHIRSVDIPTGAGNRLNILLPTTDAAGARTVCERLLAIFTNKFDGENNETVAFSLQIGASAHPGGSSLSNEYLLQKSEEALSQAKLKGPHTYVLISK
ncbi:MAG: diguanylate cyclase [Chloroflexi bacterium]|nr:diguanylate cyclase [Chloroflexota bacterium]